MDLVPPVHIYYLFYYVVIYLVIIMQDTFSLLSMAMRKQALSLCVLLGRARWSPLCPFSGGDWHSVGLLDGLPTSPKNPAVFVPAAAACYPLDVQQ